MQERHEEIEQIFANQERLRENLGALGQSRDEQGLRERYVEALSEEEDKLADMRQQIQQWKDEKGELQQQIDKMVRELRVEVKLGG